MNRQQLGLASSMPGEGLIFGADYNPEQWPKASWPTDVALMKEAGINLVTVGVFSWAQLEPEEGQWNFTWLDEVLGLLHAGGIRVSLATPTASPPPWLGKLYPQTLPTDAAGHTLWYGSAISSTLHRPSTAQRPQALRPNLPNAMPSIRLWPCGMWVMSWVRSVLTTRAPAHSVNG
ncbi:beta-galactosidase [Arthrobacter alpinus]|nr:beta-galactosidase [Arthrobacter alpinus]